MEEENSPGSVLDVQDPGDDTLSRYRYQCCVAAINCIRMLSEESEVVRIVCENYEDLLIEHSDGSFVGVQVKTRRLDRPAFRATDDEVIKSFARFCELDMLFPDKFTTFDFSTNHWFWEVSENDKNLPWLLEKLKQRGTVKGLPGTNPVRKYINLICEKSGLNDQKIVSTLCKTIVNSRSEKVDAIDHRVREAIGSYPPTSGLNLSQNAKLADELIHLTFQASSKNLIGNTAELDAGGVDFKSVIDAHTLAGKCITRKLVANILTPPASTSEPIELSSLVPIDSLPTHLAVMVQKLDRGGLQAARIEQMSDLVKSFQALLFRWINKFGVEQAEERYQTLLATVNFECTEAQVACATDSQLYAPKMYEYLFQQLRARVADEHNELHGCRPEHLMGAAGMLTEQCKAWWSPKFEVEKVS